ncbi:NOP58 family protein [Candidatus Woesearchaeota archaeon]|jgi:RNA processing factor Prp31|nr:NOP58 family protein [Candidatus Woesearchaeota archaeon]MBT3537363.1 NOP58 family protein [Candidatus Woesearchaeota archaeon]MBT4697368.1 NOP58 family protein [Candidatus Woesearchaeota archaeon]MBT4717681.1 NOP58 family protein [Candidatus Woesearchaeota archaeon]MBT7106327.1 NOP58 family protein [Candidatus Woesearchaeota archaeon]
MAKTAYSNNIGCYVVDENTQIVDSVTFNLSKENFEKLSKSEWLDEEKALISKHNAVFLGKKQNSEKLQLTDDPKLLRRILNSLSDKIDLKELRIRNILETKIAIANSLTKDMLLVQSINNVEEIDKVSNTLAKRLREWYELHNPEFSRSIGDHYRFAKIMLEKNKTELLKEINVDENLSMGANISDIDLFQIRELAKQIVSLKELKTKHESYVLEIMEELCPNMLAMTGALIGAKLIAIAGDLRRLALFPASTVQLLGAEKALFRHIKTGSRPPKFGVLMQHPLVASARRCDMGKVARALANKITLALKVDIYGDKASDSFGKKSLSDLEKKFKK